MSLVVEKLRTVLEECELHQKRILYAMKKLQQFMPLTVKSYKQLNDEEIEALDQFLFRFSKLQDAIGQRLFSYILEVQEEPVKSLSFLDKLNRLEQLGAITDKEHWLYIRNLRNSVTHEYETDPEGMGEALNHIYVEYQSLSNIYAHVRQYVQDRLI